MSKSDEYRINAQECRRMSDASRNPTDKAAWLKMAEDWMRMIREPSKSASEAFDDADKKDGTHQPPSDAAH